MSKKKKASIDTIGLLKKLIIEIFKHQPYKHYNYKQVLKKLEQEPLLEQTEILFETMVESAFRESVQTVLVALTASGELMEVDRGKYKLFPVQQFITGKIDIATSGTAYVVNENFEEDIIIQRQHTLNAMKGDMVKVSLFAQRSGKRSEGEVVEVLERARTEFVGIIQLSQRFAFLSTGNPRNGVDIFIPLASLNGATDGDKAMAKITEWNPEAKNPTGEITKVLGRPGDNNTEMDAILVEYGFPLSFPDKVEREAEEIPFDIPKKEIASRKDFRKITTFTIDPADAKDFDDALSIRKLKNNNWEIGVHIADVSYFMQPGTALDDEAFDRATSIYLVDRVIPMLPEKLSNHVCSLRPNEDKLCYSAVFEINDKAEVLTEWFGRTIIHSIKRFSYEEAQQVIETGNGDLKDEILIMDTLAKILRKERFKKGAISFEKAEVKFRLDETGFPLDVYIKESKDSNKLIEEFMLLANRKVAEFVGKMHTQTHPHTQEKPFVYRVHDSPVEERLETFALFAGKFGYRINTKSEKEISNSLNQLLKDVRGKKEQNVLEQLAIRTMAKAIYTTDNIGHYGLAFDYYTHFTSPIRRYPDVLVHRLLDMYLKDGKANVDADKLEKQCKHSTENEIRASEAERASIKFKQVQYLKNREGEVFDGIISGVTEWGIYIELVESKCEGLIRLRDLDDDFYELDDKNYCIIGHKTKKKYQLGDALKVQLKSADLQKKQIDFIVYDEFRKTSFAKPDRFEKARPIGGSREKAHQKKGSKHSGKSRRRR